MRAHLVTVSAIAALLMAAAAVSFPAASQEIIREGRKHDVGIEFLGRAYLASLCYQWTPVRSIGLEAGIGAFQERITGEGDVVAFFPIGAKIYLAPRDDALFLSAGVTLMTESADAGSFEETEGYGYAGIGYEYRRAGGFLLRGTVYGLFADGEFDVWPGLTVGYAF